jgi:hypothetical protein
MSNRVIDALCITALAIVTALSACSDGVGNAAQDAGGGGKKPCTSNDQCVGSGAMCINGYCTEGNVGDAGTAGDGGGATDAGEQADGATDGATDAATGDDGGADGGDDDGGGDDGGGEEDGGCVQATKCGPCTCAGCCDIDICWTGYTDELCGWGGGLCEVCRDNNGICRAGGCIYGCEATCDGCCDQNGTCQTGFDRRACGREGYPCQDCGATGSCNLIKGYCDGSAPPCVYDNCGGMGLGCCDGTGLCVDGKTDTNCGINVYKCEDCTATGKRCVKQLYECRKCENCPGGCCDIATGRCTSGDSHNNCGSDGDWCIDCLATANVCVNKHCQ